MNTTQQFAMGDTATSQKIGPISRTDFVRYAGAGGDFNPIHHDEYFARQAGYPSVFGHGLLTAGLLSTFVTGWLGQDKLTKFSVRYTDQVWPGDELWASGEVTHRIDDDAAATIECDLWVHAAAPDEERRLVLQGSASACIHQEV